MFQKKYKAVTAMLLLFFGQNVYAQQQVISKQNDMLLMMGNPDLLAQDMGLALLPAGNMSEEIYARWPQAVVKAEKVDQIAIAATPGYAIELHGCTRLFTWQDADGTTPEKNKIALPHRFEVVQFVGVTHDNKPILKGRFKECRGFGENNWDKRLYGSLHTKGEDIFLQLAYDDAALQAAAHLSEHQAALLDNTASFPMLLLSNYQLKMFAELPLVLQENLKNNGSLRACKTFKERICVRENKIIWGVCGGIFIPTMIVMAILSQCYSSN